MLFEINKNVDVKKEMLKNVDDRKNIDSGLVLINGIEEYREIRGIINKKGIKEGWLYIEGKIKLVYKSFRLNSMGVKRDLWRVL